MSNDQMHALIKKKNGNITLIISFQLLKFCDIYMLPTSDRSR